MQRWKLWAAAALACLSTFAQAQGIIRDAPKDVRPAVMAVSATPPDVMLDGKADRLSPGARIRDLNNMMVLSGSLAGKSVYTVYKRDSAGLVHEVWLLTADEYAKLGGTGASGDGEGYKRFMELLNIVWAARALAGLK
ncbi:hypothetical protein FN976_24720 [Caenimonas sedimenti]|uniref:Uncharacterized protein n=1 Tax=Caenimonas sedimenti TaxID=2596921 RepID=A0A562ZGY0_9BURK|nr:hypothetical protein [Caenimonas sedimenti]TWO67840.1 hypothetical protein FN976_24720 [Caenimonas sedimenti]